MLCMLGMEGEREGERMGEIAGRQGGGKEGLRSTNGINVPISLGQNRYKRLLKYML